MSPHDPDPPPRTGPGVPVERVREKPPVEGSWRGDPLAGSRHSRLADELPSPQEDRDPSRAAALCAEASRTALGDLSPALVLLPESERRRVQTLATYALTLYDFVRQTGLEGERLSQVNRWEFELDAALEGRPTGQPVFVAVACQQEIRPWNPAGFDRLHACARSRIARSRPTTPEAARSEAVALAGALAGTLLEDPPEAAVELLAAAIRLEGLRNLGDALRRHRPTLPASEMPDAWETAPAASRQEGGPTGAAQPIAREAGRLRRIVEAVDPDATSLPTHYRRAARFLRSSCLVLLERIDREGEAILTAPPRLGLGQRLRLLISARFSS